MFWICALLLIDQLYQHLVQGFLSNAIETGETLVSLWFIPADFFHNGSKTRLEMTDTHSFPRSMIEHIFDVSWMGLFRTIVEIMRVSDACNILEVVIWRVEVVLVVAVYDGCIERDGREQKSTFQPPHISTSCDQMCFQSSYNISSLDVVFCIVYLSFKFLFSSLILATCI